MKKYIYITVLLFITSCGSESDFQNVDSFNRSSLLSSTYDNIIIPAYNDFNNHLTNLDVSIKNFTQDISQENLNTVRSNWVSGYIAWQNIAMFNIRLAEANYYSSIMNIYPCDENQVDTNIMNSIDSLIGYSPTTSAASGFPALGYMIYGLGNDSSEVLSYYMSNNADDYIGYLNAVINQMTYNTNLIINDWNNNKSAFVNASGNSASSSLNMIVNDYIKYFEKRVREAKIATPSGVRDGNPLATHVESFYRPDINKRLVQQAFLSVERFYYGTSFFGLDNGVGLEDYLEDLPSTQTLRNDINTIVNSIKIDITELEDNFVVQINTGQLAEMHALFFSMQSLVGKIKTDMMSKFQIKTDYMDNDGD